MLADILDNPLAAHLAVEIARTALKAAHQKAKMMLAISRPIF